MSEQINLEAIDALKQKHENIAVTIGISLGMILVFFFFSYAQLIDRMPPIFIQVQTTIAVLIVAALFFIKRIAFSYLKLRHGQRAEFKPLLAVLTANDMERKTQALLDEKFPSQAVEIEKEVAVESESADSK